MAAFTPKNLRSKRLGRAQVPMLDPKETLVFMEMAPSFLINLPNRAYEEILVQVPVATEAGVF